MHFLITALRRSATLNKTTGEKSKQQKKAKWKHFTEKLKRRNLKASSSNVKKTIRRKLYYASLFSCYYEAYGTLY